MITPISETYIPYGSVCHRAQKWFEATNGRVFGEEAQCVISYGHTSIINNFALPPKTFSIGEHSAAIECFGEDWCMGAEVTGQPGIPDWEAEAKLNQAYYEVMKTGQPLYHFIEEDLQCVDGLKRLRWFRTLLPVHLDQDVRLILCSIDIVRENS